MSTTRVPQFTWLSEGAYKKYEEAARTVRRELARGKTYEQACEELADIEADFRLFIRQEFLKTLIAEEHFGAGVEISDIALLLDLPYEEVESSLICLLNDMVEETARHLGQEGETVN